MSGAALKVLVIGPSKSRKSVLTSFLAGVADSLAIAPPGPTVGCRILETERNGVGLELWDVAGDQAFEAGWPALQKGADACLLVYNPEVAGAIKEVELWAEWFIAKLDLPPERCLCYKLAGGAAAAGGELENLSCCCRMKNHSECLDFRRHALLSRMAARGNVPSSLTYIYPPFPCLDQIAAPSLGPIPVEVHNTENDANVKKSFDRFATRLITLGKFGGRRR
jgi:hypothetical protein